MENQEKLNWQHWDTQDEEKDKKTQHKMWWTPIYTNKHK